MEKIVINTQCSSSEILVGEKWEAAFGMIPDRGSVIITDDNVLNLYGDRFPEIPVFSVTPGETSKKLESIEFLSGQLLSAGIDRSGFVLAIGGGVVCDLAGFLASVYMRGLRCGYVSSTLLSQVDASTGGKNGVNLGGTKNMIGTIRQPEFVICDPSMLKSLPEEEYLSGLAELIKTAVIGDKNLFSSIENSQDEIRVRNTDFLTSLVTDSVKFKGLVVSQDENETGLRRILNFGHTFGHAVEMFKGVKHGFAVASGMELATEFSYRKGFVTLDEKQRIIKLLNNFSLIERTDIPVDQMKNLVLHDKKKTGNEIHFVFTNGIGKALVENVPVDEVLDFYKSFREINLEL